MSLLDDLQAILIRETQVSGRVVFVGDGVARVATSRGVVEAAASGDLGVGDLVAVREGMAVRMNRGLGRVFYV
ncbi:MAG: hypothetical protein HQL99_11375 [Magnetococcales bacterium]|nr:hypothetical protein [Magnetococcales bacterium]